MKHLALFLAGAAAGYLGVRAIAPTAEPEVHVHVRVLLDGETLAETAKRELLRDRRGGGFGFQ